MKYQATAPKIKNVSRIRTLLRRNVERLLRVDGRESHIAFARQSGSESFILEVPISLDDQLVARLLELHETGRAAGGERVYFAGWELDLIERRLVGPNGNVVHLPRSEFALLRAFVSRPRHLWTRGELALLTRRNDRAYPSARTIDSYVCRLRRHLRYGGGNSFIRTARKIGYAFEVDVVCG